jgi:predicted dehydrogenase
LQGTLEQQAGVLVAVQFHLPMALDAGKHVLLEKPMGVTVEEWIK